MFYCCMCLNDQSTQCVARGNILLQLLDVLHKANEVKFVARPDICYTTNGTRTKRRFHIFHNQFR